MQGFSWRHFKHAFLGVLTLAGAAGWMFVIYAQNRSNEPMEIVRKHFAFYPEYQRGVWREAQCASLDRKKCREITYTVPVKGCGPVNFEWQVFPGEDADTSWSYNGPTPKFDETQYPLYATLSEDSHLIDSTALGKPLPEKCRLK
jgi:hypothetical protein